MYCDLQPFASARQTAYRIGKRIPALESETPDKIIVAIDLEDRGKCPVQFAGELEFAIAREIQNCSAPIRVIVKNVMFENWLVSDLAAIRQMSGFNVSEGVRKKVEKNKGDGIDALKLLKQMHGGTYDKMSDGARICQKVKPERMALHSRSFRKCLREIGVQKYRTQSKVP